MFKDELAYDLAGAAVAKFVDSILVPETIEKITDMIVKYRGGKAVMWHKPIRGIFNACFIVELDVGWAMMRVPIPGVSPFRDEKTSAEVNMMRYVAQNTTIPVPRVYHWGYAAENPADIGPFIIMDYFPETTQLSEFLADPYSMRVGYCIDLGLSDDRILELLQPMANIMLQLDSLKMPRIGCLVRSGDSWTVGSRPLGMNMTEIVTFSGCPKSVFPHMKKTYSNSAAFYCSLADQHMAQFLFQHNTTVECKHDGRDKYMARYLFRHLAYKGELARSLGDYDDNTVLAPESFKLVCDSLSPTNVLVDKEGKLVAVIDWEFSFFGPASMASASPWWLLLRRPEYWGEGGYDDWSAKYPQLLYIFLEALKIEEDKAKAMSTEAASSLGNEPQSPSLREGESKEADEEAPLSVRMRQSWDSGNFWINWAARTSYTLDAVYWKYLDERFWGRNKRGGYEGRTSLLSRKEDRMMRAISFLKMVQKQNPKLDNMSPEYAQRVWNKVLARRRAS